MVTHQGCPQTPGGRIRALGFARMGARGRRRGPIPAMCQYQGSPVLYHRALMVTHQGCPQTPGGRIRALGFARMGARGRRRGPRTGDVSVSGLAGIIPGWPPHETKRMPV